MMPRDVARILVVASIACTAGAVALARVVVQESATSRPPTFNQEVAPILFGNCVSCHRPGDVAPMSLVSYEAARPWARAIKTKVLAGEMPPWPADPRYGEFRNTRSLTDAQIRTLAAWVDAGAPQGDGTPPPPPKFLEGWTSEMDRPPDQVIDAPLEFELPASGEIPVIRVWTKAPFSKEKFVEAIQVRPTNRATIHHASVFRAQLPD